MRGGIFHNREGVKSMLVTAPDGKTYYRKISDRITSGYMEVPKYPHRGWIMERWMPPHLYGSKEEWSAHKSEDGTPMMGPFPEQGGYFMINGPFVKMPDWSDMENAMKHYECEQRLKPSNFAAALKQAIKDEKDELEARQRKMEEEIEKMRQSELVPMLKSTSLSAQRFRQHLNAMVGDRGQLGII
jgi:hypothetical protein